MKKVIATIMVAGEKSKGKRGAQKREVL